jgi:hypothetical protein
VFKVAKALNIVQTPIVYDLLMGFLTIRLNIRCMKRIVIFNFIKDAITFLKLSAESAGKHSDLEMVLIPDKRNHLQPQRRYSDGRLAIDSDTFVIYGEK